MYVYIIICVQMRQKNIVIKQVENSNFTYHLSWTWRIVKVA